MFKRILSRVAGVLILLTLLELALSIPHSEAGQAVAKPLIWPSSGWGIFTGTVGDMEVMIDQVGIAVRIEIPREFLRGRKENDTSFLASDISNDYYYYSVIDQSLHCYHNEDAPGYKPDFSPYDPNAPFTIEIWSRDGSGFVEFTPPKHIWMREITAPTIAGVYELPVYVAEGVCKGTGRPAFPSKPAQVLSIKVSMGPLPVSIRGIVFDPLVQPIRPIRACGVVYALDTLGKPVARSFVRNDTGFFNITGLCEGDYTLEASTGYCNETGYSYLPTRYAERIHMLRGGNISLSVPLKRGCTIKGHIAYTDPNNVPVNPLSHHAFTELHHPWSESTDRITGLNYTVEALTEDGKTVASFSARATGGTKDPFVLVERREIRSVGYPALGTAYSGFPPGKYFLKAWVYGYIQKRIAVTTVSSYIAQNVEVTLVTGGWIGGTIGFRNPRNLRPETPRMAEIQNFGTSTGTMYGGNVLVSAYDSNGECVAVSLIRGTLSNGTTAYADRSIIRFHLIGFSESLNKTYSGVWNKRDYGIPSGTYLVKVAVRGYHQQDLTKIVVVDASNSSCDILLVRQGALSTVVASNTIINNRQIETPWAHRGLAPEPRLRLYVSNHDGFEVGHVEARLGVGAPMTSTAPLNFTGRNCTVEEITYQGYVPNSLTNGTYTLRAFTFGYFQKQEVRATISEGFASENRIQLLQGLDIGGTVWIRADGFISSLTENVEVKVEVYGSSGDLVAAALIHSYQGAQSFNFRIVGLRGAGHFFYVTSKGERLRDCGLQAGRYIVRIHDFGDQWQYRVERQITIQIETTGSTMHILANRMNKIFGKTLGNTPEGITVPLSWVKIAAGNKLVYSIDGRYTLHVQQGTNYIVFSLPAYFAKSLNCTLTGTRAVELDITLDPI